jgi:L-asparaginase
MAANKHRVLLITTGGTIAGNVAANSDDERLASLDAQFQRDAAAFEQLIAPTRDYLTERIGKEIEIEAYRNDEGEWGLCDVDSSDIKPKIWVDLAQLIYDKFDAYDSFIVTHGTNTLGYTCAALSFAIANSGKPIVLTGSQVPAQLPGTDASTNLENALRVAVWQPRPGQDEWMQGVMAVFGSYIITGTRVKKATEFDYDAFQSFSVGSIGRIGRIIHINKTNLEKHRSYLASGRFPMALHQRELVLQNEFHMNIASLTEFPGMNEKLFEALVERQNVDGFVLRAFGAGDPATTLRPAFEYLKNNQIPIVVTTQAPNGNSNFQVNDPGQWLRNNNMAIPAYDMSIEAITTKLGWLLAKKKAGEMTYRTLCEEMVNDLRGEINPLWEIG